MDCSLPGSSIHGILQARILEWVAVSFSRGLPDLGIEPRSPALQADALTSEPPGKPKHSFFGGEGVLLCELRVPESEEVVVPACEENSCKDTS